MNFDDMLLFYSFSQIAGVSSKAEASYWHSGQTLYSLAKHEATQQSLFDSDSTANASNSYSALLHGDATFFQRSLDKKLYYRVAYSFPCDIMFLDIETTGLSTTYHYVTYIGWMLNGKYNCWFQGTDPQPFRSAFQSAKMIVTFNGTLFDCKFLDQLFHTNEFSQKANLDLMSLCRRFKLTGGQKKIERIVGFTRPESLSETDGKEAIALWYSFLFGKPSALKRLIQYNYHDILGMIYILDWVFFEKIYGHEFPKLGSPTPFHSNVLIPKYSELMPSPSVCKNIRTYVKEHISNFSRNALAASDSYCIVGIDLAGKVNRRTGLCLLKGSFAQTTVAHTDNDIMQFVQNLQPDLISIDAPLSLPKGRVSAYDDDPARESAGIMRYCERELKRRGINSYPALIRSMQELTRRGISLSQQLRKIGYPVIECFPGAAQDIVQLPRKRTDESLLKVGLTKFGIRGAFRNKQVCHDELDAITAALVGQFYVSGYYEPLGIPEENDMIIPQKQHRPSTHDFVIGLAGPIASGKTTVGRYFESCGFHYVRYSQVIQHELSKLGYPAHRENLRNMGASLFSGNYQYILNETVALSVESHKKVVVDGMRHFEDYTFWKERCFKNFILIYIDTEYLLRQDRFTSRNDEHISYETAMSHPAEADVNLLKSKADYIVHNNASLEDLYASIRSLLPELHFE